MSNPYLSNCCVQHCRFINYRAGQAGPGPAACVSFLIKLTSNAPNTTQQLPCCSRGTAGTTEYWILNTNTHLGPAILIIICKVGVAYSEPVLGSQASIPLSEPMSRTQGVGVSRESVLFSSGSCINFSHCGELLLLVLQCSGTSSKMSSKANTSEDEQEARSFQSLGQRTPRWWPLNHGNDNNLADTSNVILSISCYQPTLSPTLVNDFYLL